MFKFMKTLRARWPNLSNWSGKYCPCYFCILDRSCRSSYNSRILSASPHSSALSRADINFSTLLLFCRSKAVFRSVKDCLLLIDTFSQIWSYWTCFISRFITVSNILFELSNFATAITPLSVRKSEKYKDIMFFVNSRAWYRKSRRN